MTKRGDNLSSWEKQVEGAKRLAKQKPFIPVLNISKLQTIRFVVDGELQEFEATQLEMFKRGIKR